MPSKKQSHLQRFGIIHFSNLNLTHIRTLGERNKIIFMSFPPWKLVPWIILYSLFFFSPSHVAPGSTRVYFRVGRWVLSSFYFCQVGLPNCWRQFFLFCENQMDAKLVCQTAGDAYSTTIHCSNAIGLLLYTNSVLVFLIMKKAHASLKVCQILLGKSCVSPTSKNIWHVKKESISNSLT
jgi:hypothetical protein